MGAPDLLRAAPPRGEQTGKSKSEQTQRSWFGDVGSEIRSIAYGPKRWIEVAGGIVGDGKIPAVRTRLGDRVRHSGLLGKEI